MQKIKWAVVLGVGLAISVLVPIAHADTISFSLTQNTCTGGCSPGPFGNFEVTTDGQAANTVLVTETLLNGSEFVRTGSGYALAFSLTGDPTIAIGSLTPGFTVGNKLT